jgi:hypothetical protein
MDIYLLIQGQHQGPFTEDQVWESLQKGLIQPNVQAWHEGLPHWVTAAEITFTSPVNQVDNSTLQSEITLPTDDSETSVDNPPLPPPLPSPHSSSAQLVPERSQWQSPPASSNWLRRILLAIVLIAAVVGLGLGSLITIAIISSKKAAPPSIADSLVSALKQDDQIGKDYRAQVKALKADDQSPDEYCDRDAQLIREVVVSMRNIDLSNCPADFREAYINHTECWSDLGETFANHPHVTSDGEGAFGELLIAAVGGDAQDVLGYATDVFQGNQSYVNDLKDKSSALRTSWDNVQTVVTRYGVRPSDYSN